MKMNKTYRTKLRRVFLIQDLPAPLTRASFHLQIFDNYIENTQLRLRTMRSPETKEWTWILQKREPLKDFSEWKISEIFLSEAEHQLFEIFEGRAVSQNERAETNEIRKNRYFYEYDEKEIELDVFLGKLWGLNTAQILFETAVELQSFQPPPFVVAEITSDEFFFGENLVGKSFADIQAHFSGK